MKTPFYLHIFSNFACYDFYALKPNEEINMKTLTTKATLAAVLVVSALSLPALAGKGDGKQGQQRFRQLAELLELTEAQMEPVKLILKEQKAAHRALGKTSAQEHQAIALEGKDKLSEILDEAQLLQLNAYMQGMKQGRGPRW